jgi:hypothetical protein
MNAPRRVRTFFLCPGCNNPAWHPVYPRLFLLCYACGKVSRVYADPRGRNGMTLKSLSAADIQELRSHKNAQAFKRDQQRIVAKMIG